MGYVIFILNRVHIPLCPPSRLQESFAYCLIQIPLIDTRSCTADFRTNSFVGTEGVSPCYLF